MGRIISRRLFALMLASSLPCGGGNAAASTSPCVAAAFRDEVIAVGRRHFPDMPFTSGRGVVLSGGHTLYLNNIFMAVQDLPPINREAAIAQWLSSFTPEADVHADAVKKATDEWQDARPLLRPRLLNRASARIMPRIVKEAFSPELSLAFTIDLGDKDLYVSDEKFARWKVPQAEVRAAAIANLETMPATLWVDAISEKDAPGRYAAISTGDGYDAARLALPAFRKTLMAALGPAFFAAVPARDLMICWSTDFGKQEAMVRVVEENEARMPHALTSEMFLVDDAGLHPMRAVPEP